MRGVLYLASTSPRRRALLSDAGLTFELHPPGPEPSGCGTPEELAMLRARAKAVEAPIPAARGWILGVDTVVGLDAVEFGKPRGRADAVRMLTRLRGVEHSVFSAHCLVESHPERPERPTGTPAAGRRTLFRCATSRVRCREFTAAELEAYLDRGDWTDKAGAYGIQGAAAALMTLVAGDLDTVIGLHLGAVRSLLEAAS